MEEGAASKSSSSPWAPIFDALKLKGWCFRDAHHLPSSLEQAMAAAGKSFEVGTSGLVELELLNMDLREFGGRCLPDPSSLKKSAYFHGPKVLQIVSVRDVSRSMIDASMKSSSQHRHRLLRFCLTDGFSEVTAVEYVPIPSITDETVPGTKVLLQNRVPVNSGILCLDPKSIRVLGGRVETLYEEWEMSQKYSGFSRSSLRSSQSIDSSGPPPFEKLQIGSRIEGLRFSDTSKLNVKPEIPMRIKSSGVKTQATHNVTTTSSARIEDKPSSSDSRPKEVSSAIPMQNQEAAQKLLQKMNHPNWEERHIRGPKNRGKSNYNEPEVFTLDEWEKRKGGAKSVVTNLPQDVSRDEELAWQLQNHLDMEDYQVQSGPKSEAEQIRRNMFNYGNADDRSDGRTEFRGRGRGRGHGRGRGRRRHG